MRVVGRSMRILDGGKYITVKLFLQLVLVNTSRNFRRYFAHRIMKSLLIKTLKIVYSSVPNHKIMLDSESLCSKHNKTYLKARHIIKTAFDLLTDREIDIYRVSDNF